MLLSGNRNYVLYLYTSIYCALSMVVINGKDSHFCINNKIFERKKRNYLVLSQKNLTFVIRKRLKVHKLWLT